MRALGRDTGGNGAEGSIDPAPQGREEAAPDSPGHDSGWAEETPGVQGGTGPGWLAGALATLAVAGWTGFFGWAHLAEMRAGAAPQEWAAWIVQWAVPVALIGVVWLLAMRASYAEARRFAGIAARMNRESAVLEARLKVVNRELSLAREFLAAEARDLDALGRIAAERLSAHAGELQNLITSNGAQVEAISATSETALGNMNRLRDDLPVIANAARDVANQIGSAGRVAEGQLARLSDGFERLAEIGSTSEVQVTRLGAEVGATLDEFETTLARIEAMVAERFAALQAGAESHREQLGTIEAEALAALGARSEAVAGEIDALAARLGEANEATEARFGAAIAALHDTLVEKLRLVEELDRNTSSAASGRIAQLRAEADRADDEFAERNRRFAEMVEQREAVFETQAAQASELIAQRFAALDDELSRRREAQLAEIEKLVAQGDAMAERVAQLGKIVGEVNDTSTAARENLGAGLGTLARQLAEKRAALAETEAQLAQLTDSSVRLLEIVQAGTRSCREDLGEAIFAADAAIEGVEARARAVEGLMLTSAQAGGNLSDNVLRTRADIAAADAEIAAFTSRLAAETEDTLARLAGLREGFARLAGESDALAGETRGALREALAELESAILRTFATLEAGVRERVPVLAASLSSEVVVALERSLRNETAEMLGKIEQTAAHASGVGREAAIQLRDQLVKVNELTGNLEQRIARARELAEEQVNNDFAKRMALITDSLNSAAIDIAAALSTEVSDTAWDAYLKGDRGIFTRRAVNLVDKGAARQIGALYTSDEAFKANVSRYIHDFEALLRQTLSTRDGHVLSVTMLGSDMGKLYVALAQAIERFR